MRRKQDLDVCEHLHFWVDIAAKTCFVHDCGREEENCLGHRLRKEVEKWLLERMHANFDLEWSLDNGYFMSGKKNATEVISE